jgi:hypothetical protein
MTETSTDSAAKSARLRFELLFATAWILFGLIVLPALIYLVGVRLLGPYPGGAGFGAFFGDFFADLFSGSTRIWVLILGPYVAVMLLRGLLGGIRLGHRERHPPPAIARREPQVEPGP